MDDSIRITFLGHAGFKVQTPEGSVILVDPWLRENPVCPESLKTQERVDLILVTHGHGDHMDPELPALISQTGAKFIGPGAVRWHLIRKGAQGAVAMNTGGTVDVDGITVTMTPAFHGSHISLSESGVEHTHEAVGYVLEPVPGHAIYIAGDTALFGDMRLIGELYHPEIAILPIGGRYTMGPREAAHALRLLGVNRVIPCHYGSLPDLKGTPEELAGHASDMEGLQIHVLKPGETLDLSVAQGA